MNLYQDLPVDFAVEYFIGYLGNGDDEDSGIDIVPSKSKFASARNSPFFNARKIGGRDIWKSLVFDHLIPCGDNRNHIE